MGELNIEYKEDDMVIIYYTKYSKGRYIINYDYYLSNDRFRRRIEKALSNKDIIGVVRMSYKEWISTL